MPRRKSKQNFLKKIFWKNPNAPRAFTLAAGITLWFLGIAGYFWLGIPNLINIWSLILATILLLAGSIFKAL